ncbi:hypothetical protein AVEN_155012-1 [Araneus ventricosus]|uniref:DNA helicase Pif1-like 2B domain-containing protein n=1 Tax=Araneus ventricosus TaxID=182803 RepID=A0A4Y2A8Z2_ARAVE|nr:hypothetical protein AVEN_155012-1 [Araneus ventricosus]
MLLSNVHMKPSEQLKIIRRNTNVPQESISSTCLIDVISIANTDRNGSKLFYHRSSSVYFQLYEVAEPLNFGVISRIADNSVTSNSIDFVESDDLSRPLNYQMEFYDSLTPSSLPSRKLTLKVATIVMLIRNLNKKAGLANGTRSAPVLFCSNM